MSHDSESKIELLIFEIAVGSFAVPVSDVSEVIQMVSLASEAPQSDPVDGVINLRGKPISVIDMSSLLFEKRTELLTTDHLIVTEHAQQQLALRVQRATNVNTVRAEECTAADASNNCNGLIRAFCAPSHSVVSILDMECVLQEAKVGSVSANIFSADG